MSPLVTWLASALNDYNSYSSVTQSSWQNILLLTSLPLSMAVNALVTGLIVFRIVRVSMGVKPTSIERTLGSTGGNKFQHILFIIIESAMALFAIQLVRVVLGVAPWSVGQEPSIIPASDCVIVINQMLNVIILFIYISV